MITIDSDITNNSISDIRSTGHKVGSRERAHRRFQPSLPRSGSISATHQVTPRD